jgi:hypothetical protein
MIYLGTKTQTIVAGTYVYNFDFTQTEFTASAFYSLIQGGFALFIDIDNKINSPIYIGIEITSDSGVINLNDRAHIGFCPGSSHTVISYASAPSLGNVRVPDIRKIRIIVYTFDFSASVPVKTVSIALWIDNPREGIAAQNIIGRDAQAIQPFSYFLFGSNETSIAANTSNVLIADMTAGNAWPNRMLVSNIWLYAAITPYPIDLRVYVQSVDAIYGTSPIANVFSHSDEPSILNIARDFIIPAGNNIEIRADNRNTANAYKAGGLITATPIY